ncbi:MAG: type II toxin-antitoxin system ParD family antitoxin [Plectolyngbya sp. WJT66-NPBG17]|jgi:antitoxin ParD1/3/4|nr:type II toxin-antitoxin system ParD family antitoxin [Plectolyngbya sp. WJT66-NPBG17]MBW4527113.1 type II toxin-antitoxin system ParD family antitoxin [Phormidium tanganyikae FI6-MK23]
MNITLKPEQAEFVRARLTSGRYRDPDDVIDKALTLLEQQEQRLEELRQKIAIGTEQIQNGQVTDGETVFANFQAKINRFSQSDT